MLTSLNIFLTFRNAHNNKEICSLTGPMACGIIVISKSVTLLSSRVIYGIIVINKSMINITHMWEILISSQAVCGMSMISVNARLLLEE